MSHHDYHFKQIFRSDVNSLLAHQFILKMALILLIDIRSTEYELGSDSNLVSFFSPTTGVQKIGIKRGGMVNSHLFRKIVRNPVTH